MDFWEVEINMLKVKWGIQVGKRFIAQEFIFMPTFMLWSWTRSIPSIPSDYLLISDRIHKACIPNSGTRASWAQCLYSALLCLFSAICKVARQPTMHGGYHFTGPFHWGNLHLSAAGQITQESITRRSKKVRVIIMSSQVTKVPEIEYCPLESRQRTWKEERRDSYRMRKRYVDRQRRILGNNNILQ